MSLRCDSAPGSKRLTPHQTPLCLTSLNCSRPGTCSVRLCCSQQQLQGDVTQRRLQLFVVLVHEPRRCAHCWCWRHTRDEHRKTYSATGAGAAHIASAGTTDSVMHITTGTSVAIPAGAGAMSSTTCAGTTITARASALGSTPWSKSCGCCRSWCAVLLSQCRCFEHCRSSCAPPPVQVLPLLQKLVRCTASTSAGAATTTRVGAMYFSQRSRCCGPCRSRCDVLHWSRGTFLPWPHLAKRGTTGI